MKRYRFFSTLLILLSLVAVSPSLAGEVIKNYDVYVEIHEDSSMTVTENITASVENIEINRGIIRVFPVSYTNSGGRTVRVGFDVIGAAIDGKPAGVSVTSSGRYKEARVGDMNRILARGDHTFTITYKTTRQLGFFENFDELYWNVTGNDWHFPILSASCLVKLPYMAPGEGFKTIEWYTGTYGKKGAMSDAVLLPDGTVKTARALGVGEGLTIALTWPKGIVAPPQKTAADIPALPSLIGAATLALVSLWLTFAWYRWGREPKAKAVIPLFYPPNGASPAFTRCAYALRIDNTSFASAILGLAVKGALKIKEGGDKRLGRKGGPITLIKEPKIPVNLQPEENLMLEQLFALGADTVELKQKNRQRLSNTKLTMEMYLLPLKKKLYKKNTSKMLPALAIFAAGETALALSGLEPGVVAFTSFFGGVAIISGMFTEGMPKRGAIGIFLPVIKIVAPFLLGTALTMALISNGFGYAIFLVLTLILAIAFYEKTGMSWLLRLQTIPFLIIGIICTLFFREMDLGTRIVPCLLFASSAALISFMRPLIMSRTEKGANLLSKIEGLRLYMNTAEKSRLELLNPPEETPELFERLLPYALALDSAKTWANRFEKILQAAQYQPNWYTGPSPHIFIHGASLDNFSRNLQSQMTSSMRTPATAPGSSSGSGGGGFSGGGGGGGGGRGW